MLLYGLLEKHANNNKCCCTDSSKCVQGNSNKCCKIFCFGFCAQGQQLTVRTVLKTMPKKQQISPRNLCQTIVRPPWNTCPSCCMVCLETHAQNCLELCASPCCTDLLKCCLGMHAKVLFSFSSLLRNLLFSLLLLLSICSWKKWMTFSLLFPHFPPLT